MKKKLLSRITVLLFILSLLCLGKSYGQAPSISANPSTPICQNTNVTFTVVGPGPHRWLKNNTVIAGATNVTYSSSTLNNGDQIRCQRLVGGVNVWLPSNIITMNVTANINPSVSISSNAVSNAACSGSPVTFTAVASKPETNPTYQWKINNINAGTNQSTFVTNSLPSGSPVVTCVVSYNASACVNTSTVTSNSLTMVITSSTIVSVSIASDATSNRICTGTSVNFTATPSLPGSVTSYQWKKNGTNVGTNSSTYGSSTISNNDEITCAVTYSGSCLNGNPATSNIIKMRVSSGAAPVLTLTGSPASPVCKDDLITFTATYTTLDGDPVSFLWKYDYGSSTPSTCASGGGWNVCIRPSLFNSLDPPFSCIMHYNDVCTGTEKTVESNSLIYAVKAPGTWVGEISTDWHTANNWCGKAVPGSSTDVIINGGTTYAPIISSNAVCNNITINSGATLQLNNNNFSVSGNWINNGTFTSSGTNIFAGTTTISGSSSHAFNNISITGDLIAPSLLSLTGNWSNSGSALAFDNGGGQVTFTGSNAQTISGSNTFYALRIDKSSNNVTLNSTTNVSSQLNLTLGKIITTSSKLLTLLDNATVTGSPSNTSFVEGPVKKTGDDAFVFPIGKTVYRPVEMSAPGSTNSFVAEYFNTPPSNITLSGQITLSTCEYWKIDQTSGSSPIQLIFNWHTNSCEGVREDLIEIMQSPTLGSSWTNMASVKNISTKVVSAANVSSFGYFTFGYNLPKNYAALTQKLDGGFYIADRGNLFIHYNEEYEAPGVGRPIFKYRIIDQQRNVITSYLTTPLNKQIGINQYAIPLNYCSYADGQYYILEVTDEKNENTYLQFKYIKPSITVTCP